MADTPSTPYNAPKDGELETPQVSTGDEVFSTSPNNASPPTKIDRGVQCIKEHEDAPVDIPGDLIFTDRPEAERPSQYHKPPIYNPDKAWEFCPGTDISNAILGKPDPSKFFLCRQRASDPTVKDLREYPRWRTFDWNDPDHISALNNARVRQFHVFCSLVSHTLLTSYFFSESNPCPNFRSHRCVSPGLDSKRKGRVEGTYWYVYFHNEYPQCPMSLSDHSQVV